MNDSPALPTPLPEAGVLFQGAANPAMRHIRISTHDIHDILRGVAGCPVTLNGLQRLIHSQAALHRAHAKEDLPGLKAMLTSRGSTLRGFVLNAEGNGPVAYAVYYPMIDGQGERVAYCEDFFIMEAYRGHGVSAILFHELAKRVMDEGAVKLQWATDKRNGPVHKFVKKNLGATHPDIITIAANDLLDINTPASKSLTAAWEGKEYKTRLITTEDSNLVRILGISSNIIRNTGDLSFRGFVTTLRGKSDPVAITPGWTHLSTFRLKEGIHLEQPVFANGHPHAKIVASIAQAARKHVQGNDLDYFRWHIQETDGPMRAILHDQLRLPIDSMLSTPESELIVYNLTNGALTKLAKEDPDRVLHIDPSSPIGGVSSHGGHVSYEHEAVPAPKKA